MSRWVLRHPDANQAPSSALDLVGCDPDVTIIERATSGLALIDAPDDALPRVRRLLPGWRIHPEREGQLPE